jgi:hypothetical protein
MVTKRFNGSNKIQVFLMALVSILVSCTVGETANEDNVLGGINQTHKTATLPTTTPTPTAQILPTRTLDFYRPDTVRATYAAEATQKAGEPTSIPNPSSSPTLSPKQLCQPFPDEIQYLGSTTILGYPAWTLRAYCKGEIAHFRSPVGDMLLLDYTSLTGRFVYGPTDTNESGLWVYDYWLELSEKWLDKKVLKAEWAPVRNAEDVQVLAILDHDGNLSISSEPFQIYPIATGVNHFTISPAGDKVAYVKGDVLYVIPIQGGQARKLAENAYGMPIWSVENNAILLPSTPVKITYLDGSGSFIPQLQPWIKKRVGDLCDGSGNCALSSSYETEQILWDEQSHFLVFYSTQPNDEEKFRTLHIYELSEDLRWVDNLQTIYGDFTNGIHWDTYGQSIIDSVGNVTRIGLASEIFSIEARILSVEDQVLMVEFVQSPMRSSTLAQLLSHVTLTDQTQVIDINGNLTHLGVLKSGMIIEISARKLSPYTLSIFAYTIQITCDQNPCYLGIEGRS